MYQVFFAYICIHIKRPSLWHWTLTSKSGHELDLVLDLDWVKNQDESARHRPVSRSNFIFFESYRSEPTQTHTVDWSLYRPTKIDTKCRHTHPNWIYWPRHSSRCGDVRLIHWLPMLLYVLQYLRGTRHFWFLLLIIIIINISIIIISIVLILCRYCAVF